MPPSDPPATAASRVDPQLVQEGAFRADHVGDRNHRKVAPYGRPVAGSIDDGPVVPRQPPSRLVLTTKKRSVSKALPGPIMPSHQPSPRPLRAVALFGAEPVARALGRRATREAGRVGVAAQRVADQDHVVTRGGQRAIGLVGDPDMVKRPAAVERERPGRSRNCVSTVPTEPAAGFGAGVVILAIISPALPRPLKGDL